MWCRRVPPPQLLSGLRCSRSLAARRRRAPRRTGLRGGARTAALTRECTAASIIMARLRAAARRCGAARAPPGTSRGSRSASRAAASTARAQTAPAARVAVCRAQRRVSTASHGGAEQRASACSSQRALQSALSSWRAPPGPSSSFTTSAPPGSSTPRCSPPCSPSASTSAVCASAAERAASVEAAPVVLGHMSDSTTQKPGGCSARSCAALSARASPHSAVTRASQCTAGTATSCSHAVVSCTRGDGRTHSACGRAFRSMPSTRPPAAGGPSDLHATCTQPHAAHSGGCSHVGMRLRNAPAATRRGCSPGPARLHRGG